MTQEGVLHADPELSDGATMLTTENVRRIIALMIGVASVTAGAMSWRGSQINSTASFDDRTSIGQTVAEAQRSIDVTVTASAQVASYGIYRETYELAGLVGDVEADSLRAAATGRAVNAGVFGPFDGGVAETATPRGFDVDARLASLTAAEETGFESGGPLDPDGFADAADDIRVRVRALQVWALVMLVAVAILTTAQVADTRAVRRSAGAIGTLAFTAAAIAAFTRDFFA